jgi:nitrogen-specific signal transduction histidine kinase
LVAFLAGWLSQEVRGVRTLHEEILANMIGGVVAIDPSGNVSFANPQARMLLCLGSDADLRGKSFETVLPELVGAMVETVRRTGSDQAQGMSVENRALDVRVSNLVMGRDRGPYGVIVIVHDISLHLKYEAVARSAERFKALAAMSASLAHEIRNPLSSIRAAAQELGRLPTSSQDDQKLLSVMVREVDRLNRILTDFVEFASDRPVSVYPCNLSEVVREVVLLLEKRVEGQRRLGIRVEVDVPPQLQGLADPDKIKQVLLNLGSRPFREVDGFDSEGGSKRISNLGRSCWR